MVSYSPDSMRAFTAIYRPYNDIDIYVEDNSLVGLYERLFGRILNGVARITSVTPLSGRDAVIEEARRLRSDKNRRRFFLLDGDFFWVLGPVPKIRNTYMLNCYSLENLAYERRPILNAAYALAPERAIASIDNAFSDEIFESTTKKLLPLFALYAIGHLLNATCETVNFSVHRLLPNNGYILSDSALRERMREVIAHLRKTESWQDIIDAKKRVRGALEEANVADSRFISGKGYLSGILLRWFQREASFRGNPRQLISLILDNSSLTVDPKLARALKRAAKAKL